MKHIQATLAKKHSRPAGCYDTIHGTIGFNLPKLKALLFFWLYYMLIKEEQHFLFVFPMK